MDNSQAQMFVGERVRSIEISDNEVEITFEDGSTLRVNPRGGDGWAWLEVNGS